ncbi:zinc knuckle CX2CX4HX4C containing protein [Tanacetum coccineum]
MAKIQEVISITGKGTGPIFNKDPLEQEERAFIASLIEHMRLEIDESKRMNKSLEASNKVLEASNKALEASKKFLASKLERYKDVNFVKEARIKCTEANADPVFDGVNISIPRKVVEKVSTRFEHTLYGYFIGKRMAFPVVEYYARNNWAKHGLKRIMMNSKGFFFFKFDSRAGLEAVLEGGPWLILFEEDGISLIATFIGKPVMLDSYTSSMCNDSWGRSSFARCLIEVNSKADLVDVVTIGIPSLSEDDFTKETIRVEYEWRPPKCDTCKIFGHVHDYCPRKVVRPLIVATSNVVTPNAEKTNDGFQTVGKKKKRKGKSKSTNDGQFTGHLVKHNVRYEPKATTSAPMKGTTYVGYTSQSIPMLKTTGNSSKKDNLSMSNSFSALNEEEDEDEEEVENVYD